MADVNANIGVQIDTSAALSQLKLLQREIGRFNQSVLKSNSAAMAKQRDIAIDLMRNVSATGKFSAELRTIRTSTEAFTTALETNKLSMREYFRFGAASTKSFGKLFKTEFETISKVARERTKDLQTRYVKLGRDANGAMKAIAIRPLALDMQDYGTKTMIAAQKQQLFNQLVKQGSTNLLNFGKNTQWAGRQLMVGFTIPITMMGVAASRTFMELEEQVVRFRKVYGEMFTTDLDTDKALADIEALGKEFTKYGIAVADTIKMAADAAQAGFMGKDLEAQVTEATRLAVLGGMEQEKSLEATIALQNAFRVSTEDLADSINFLNAVENQTVLSLDDISAAIPRVGPIVTELGGNIKDLAFFLTAMKEGGVSAEQGANALKSGLARLINPTKAATEYLADFGINLKAIIEQNTGDLRGTVVSFAEAIQSLDDLSKTRAVEKVFGKYQFARTLALLNNITRDGTQASRVLELTGSSAAELAILAERELGQVESAVSVKFTAALENLKKELMPLGKAFLEAATPIVKFVSDLLERFNGLSDGTKKTVAIITAAVGAVGPVLLMTFGLIANGVANLIKLFLNLRMGYLKLTGNTKVLGLETSYMTSEQQKNAAAAASLEQTHSRLTQIYTGETAALNKLIAALRTATKAQQDFAIMNPRAMAPGFRGSGPKKLNRGTMSVPGSGNRDTVPSMLTPGEAVIPKGSAQDPANKPIIAALVAGKKIRGYNEGTTRVTIDDSVAQNQYRKLTVEDTKKLMAKTDDYFIPEPGKESKFATDYRNASESERKVLDRHKAQYIRNRDSVEQSFLDDKNYRIDKNGNIAVKIKTKGSTSWSSLSQELFDREFGYLSGSARKDGRLSVKDFNPSRISRGLPTRPATGAPKEVKQALLKDKSRVSRLEKDNAWIKERLARAGITDKTTVANYTKIGVSHLDSPEDTLEKWAKGGRGKLAILDTEFTNQYIKNRITPGGTPKLLKALDLVEKNPGSLGYSRDKVNRLKNSFKTLSGIHPTSPQHYAMLREIAQFEVDLSKSKNTELKRMMKGTANFGNLGEVMADFIDERRRGGISGRAKVMDLSDRAMGVLKRVKRGGKVGDNQFAFLTKKEAVVTPKAQEAIRTQTGRTIGDFNEKPRPIKIPRFSGYAEGYDPNDTSSRSASSRRALYGSASAQPSAIDKSFRRKKQQREALDKKNQKALEKQIRAMEENTKATDNKTKEQISAKEKITAMSGKVAMVAGAASGLTIAASFAGGKLGELATQLMPLVFGIQGIAMLIPLLANPWVALGAGVAALGFMIWKYHNDIKKARQAGQDLAKAMGTTQDALNEYATLTKTVSATELRRREQQDSLQNVSPQDRIFGQQVLDSEFGQKILADIDKQAQAGISKSDISQNIARSLAVAITQGVLTAEQANSIAVGLGEKLRDYKISANIIGNLGALIGTNGVDLLKDPLTVRLRIAEDTAQQVSDVFERALTPETEVVQAGRGVGRRTDLNPELIGAAVQLGIQQLQTQQGLVDSLNREYDERIKNAATAEEAAKLEAERAGKVDALIAKNNEYSASLMSQIKMLQDAGKTGLVFDALKDSIGELYKEGPLKTFAQQAIKDIEKLSEDSPARLSLMMQLSSGDLDPVVASKLATMFVNNQTAEANFNLIVNTQGLDKANLLLQTLDKTDLDENQVNKFMEAFSKDDPNFDKNLAALQALTSIPTELDSTVILQTRGMAAVTELREDMDALAKYPDPVTFEAISELKKQDPEKWDAIYNSWSEIAGADGVITRTAAIQFQALGDQSVVDKYLLARGITPSSPVYQYMVNDPAVRQSATTAAWKNLNIVDEEKPGGDDDDDDGNETKEVKASFLDDLLKRLRDVRNNTIKTTKGFEASRKALDKIFGGKKKYNILSGIEQDLMKLNVQGGLIDMIVGMDPEEFETKKKKLFKFDNKGNIIALKRDAQNINKAIAAIKIGEFQADNLKVLKQVEAQDKAYAKLKKAGVDASIAIEMVKDETLAAAIATNGISTKKLEKIVDLINKINKKQEEQATTQAMDTKEGRIGLFETGFSLAMERFAALEEQIDIKYSSQLEDLDDKIKESTDRIEEMNAEIESYNFDLEEISDKEKAISEKYDKRISALEEVKRINADLVRQQKQQLTIADALSQGDIAAAASAIQEMRAQNAEAAQERVTRGLEQAKENELARITNALGMTRVQIEAEIKRIKGEIRKEEIDVLKPLQDQLEKLKETIEVEKEGLTVGGLTKKQWVEIKNGVDLAKTSGDEFDTAIRNALEAARLLKEELDKIKDKTVTVTVITNYVTGGPGAGQPSRQTLEQQSGLIKNSPEYFLGTKDPVTGKEIPGVLDKVDQGIATGRELQDYARAVNEVRKTPGAMVAASAGGLVPKYFLNGGFARGTDTVPAMLTPGEFIVSKYGVDSFGVERLKAINTGSYSDGSVYNYNLSVNVKSDANPDEIARTVMTQIKQVDSMRLRGNRF